MSWRPIIGRQSANCKAGGQSNWTNWACKMLCKDQCNKTLLPQPFTLGGKLKL